MQEVKNGINSLYSVLDGFTKPLVVCDGSFPYLSIKYTIEHLGVFFVLFDGFTPNPLFEQICKGVDLFLSEGCDSMIAVGGGSAIDVAKCIKLAVLAKEGKKAIIPPLVSQRLPIDGGKIPFIAIPTTAGTGSESTHNAVMYYEGAKQTVTNDGILPDFAILEPTVLKTLPLYQKKCTMMDALCQGIESWWSVNSTDESKEYSRKTVELIMANWRKYIFENDDDAAAQIMLAANYSGRAINIAQTTAAHAMSYKITSMYGLPHGHAVAVCLPEIWHQMLSADECIDKRGLGYVQSVFKEIANSMDCLTPEDAIILFREMIDSMDLENPVPMGDYQTEIELLASSVNQIRLKNNPVPLDYGIVSGLYRRIVQIHSSL